jgi:dTDP-4-dehydrorhamnose reductase
VVNDQIGSPTHAIDLAKAILWIITVHNQQPTIHNFGIYNFSNEGQCSWYDFAKKIFEINKISVNLTAIPTTSFPTAAKRPAFSVLDKSKIKKTFGLSILKWEDNLQSS